MTFFIINILFIQGLQFSFKPESILGPVYLAYLANLNQYPAAMWLVKPLFVCAPCMASIWGWCFWLTGLPWYLYPIWVICLAGANVITNKLLDK